MGCVLDEVRDVKEYEAGLEVSPTGVVVTFGRIED